jgi:hypothetical protein
MIKVELGLYGIVFEVELERQPIASARWKASTKASAANILEASGKTPVGAISNLKQKFHEGG